MLIITTTFLIKMEIFFNKEIKNKKKIFALFISGLFNLY